MTEDVVENLRERLFRPTDNYAAHQNAKVAEDAINALETLTAWDGEQRIDILTSTPDKLTVDRRSAEKFVAYTRSLEQERDEARAKNQQLLNYLHAEWVTTSYGPSGSRVNPMMLWRCDNCGGTSPGEKPFDDMGPSEECRHADSCPLNDYDPADGEA